MILLIINAIKAFLYQELFSSNFKAPKTYPIRILPKIIPTTPKSKYNSDK